MRDELHKILFFWNSDMIKFGWKLKMLKKKLIKSIYDNYEYMIIFFEMINNLSPIIN